LSPNVFTRNRRPNADQTILHSLGAQAMAVRLPPRALDWLPGVMHASIASAINQFNTIGSTDPRRLLWQGVEVPRQLGESACLWHYIQQLNPNPSTALQLAAHCQHLRRFAYPREQFSAGRDGYLAWRTHAARQSADESASIMRQCGIDEELVEQVVAIMTKQDRKHRADVQTMEDALCLSFLRLDALGFAGKHDLPQVLKILRRTWLKMSPAGHGLALRESFAEPLGHILTELATEPKTVRGQLE